MSRLGICQAVFFHCKKGDILPLNKYLFSLLVKKVDSVFVETKKVFINS